MSWRTVLISSRCKLDYSMGYMVIRGEETARIFIDEISCSDDRKSCRFNDGLPAFRFMRMIVFFDLPTDTEPARREYRRFRRMLIKNGFLMMQESVYCRMVLNATVEKSVAETIKRKKPSAGIVQLLTVTEKQFAAMTYIT